MGPNALLEALRWDNCLDGHVCDDCRTKLKIAEYYLSRNGLKSCTKARSGRIPA